MTFVLCLPLVLALVAPPAEEPAGRAPAAGFVLAGEPVVFDPEQRPRFTSRQRSFTADATRQGLERWARTEEGRKIIRRFQESDRTVIVREDRNESSLGRAPQPGFLTLLAAHDRTVHKYYEIVLNPAVAAEYRHRSSVSLGLPQTPADAMAVAWAAEMLHLDFYAEGIALPHHDHPAFRERWLAVSSELGFPNTVHGDDDRGHRQ